MSGNESGGKSADRTLLGSVKWFGALLVAIATILGAILAIRGDLPQLFGGTGAAPQAGSSSSSSTNSRTQYSVGAPMGPILTKINLLGNDYNHGDLSPNAPDC